MGITPIMDASVIPDQLVTNVTPVREAPANGADSGELAQAEADAKNAGAEQVNESKFTKKEIMEMRSKYLNENITSYAKKDFYNRRNGR